MRNIVILILFLSCAVFSSVSSVAISPYIINGFSKTYSLWHSSKTIFVNYSNNFRKNGFGTDITDKFLETERFSTIGIKDKFEINFSGFGFAIKSLYIRGRLRFAYNIFSESNDNNLFENIAITPFIGFYGSNYNLINWNDETRCFQYYIGSSIGTKKFVYDRYSFELFTSPTYSVLTYSPSVFLGRHVNSSYKDFKRITHEIDIPVGFRHVFEKRMVKFSIKSGIGLNIAIPNDKIKFNKYSEISYDGEEDIDCLFIRHSYFSAFAEMGFHFGSRTYNKERRKQQEQKEVLL